MKRDTTYRDWLFGKDGALFRAAAQGNLDLTKQLAEEGANVNISSNKGFTPLHRASQNGHAQIVKFLIESGANPKAASNDRNTPLTLALDNGHKNIAKILRASI